MDNKEYIQDQILEMYMDEMDYISDTLVSEFTTFDILLTEADDVPQNMAQAAGVQIKKAAGVAGDKIKAMLEKLKELLGQFVAAVERVAEIIKEKSAKLITLIKNKFKVAGKVTQETTVLKFDVALKNAQEINKIIEEVDKDIINPIENNQNPKNDDVKIYEEKFDPIEYSKTVQNTDNMITYKENQVVSVDTYNRIVNAQTAITSMADASRSRNKTYMQKLNPLIPQIERSDTASDDAKILYKGLMEAIKLHKGLMKYNTKYIGDALKLAMAEPVTKAG